jgi:hypothetical protein
LDAATARGFLETDALRAAYFELPDPSLLDSVAPAWLIEVRRFNVSARRAAHVLSSISGATAAETLGFEADIQNAVHSWFRGEKQRDGAALGGAVRHAGRAFEDLVRGVHDTVTGSGSGNKTLAEMLARVRTRLTEVAPDFEPHLLEDVSQLLRRLRNASTHEQTSPDFGRIRARLSTELLLATAEYFQILHRKNLLLASVPDAADARKKCAIQGQPGRHYFFGLDGDDTGRELERLFQTNSGPEAFNRFSAAVDSAIRVIANRVTLPPIRGEVLFASGDDILFKGQFDRDALEEMRSVYVRLSGGYTCSLGFGSTPKEAYVALKMAKAAPGKNSVMGIELVESHDLGTGEDSTGTGEDGVSTVSVQPPNKPLQRTSRKAARR